MEKNEGQRLNDTVDTSTETRIEPESRLKSKDALTLVEAAEPVPESTNDTPDAEISYITGWKLFLATGIVALASFTLLLDTSIIVTVGRSLVSIRTLLIFEGNSSHHQRFPLPH